MNRAVIPAKKNNEPPNGAKAYSPGEGSPVRGDAPLGKKELAGIAVNRDQFFDPIRREWVAATPEEAIRQLLLERLIHSLGFPGELISVEKGLRQMPHLRLQPNSRVPARRADIVCFAKSIAGPSLHPLLLIECKAVPITPAVMRQVVGYNHYMNASAIAVVNQTETRFGYFHPSKQEYVYLHEIPSFEKLKQLR